MVRILFAFTLYLISCQAFGQHEHHTAEGHEHGHEAPFHKITMIMANSLITNHVTENSEGIFVIPTFGINYDYFFHKMWGIGLHSDIVLQQFKIERHNSQQEIIRQNPVAVCAIASFKPHHRWTLLGGYGVELEKNENIDLFRLGLEYGIPINNNWELGFNLEYDHKIRAYSSFMFGVGFSKILF
jgi:hypothetical protein